jgi:signal transduction histidine kinase
MDLSAGGMSRRIAAAVAVPVLAGVAALGVAALIADAERDAAEESRAAQAAARGGHEFERAVADLERGVRNFVITGRERSLAPYRAVRAGLDGRDPRVDAYVRDELEPLVALARRDRRKARIAIARGGALARGEELRAQIHALADGRAQAAVAADDRAAARAEDLRLVAAGGAVVLTLALLCGLLLARLVRRRLRTGDLAAHRLGLHRAVGKAIASGAGPDTLLRELADALEAELGALHVRTGDGPFRLAAVRGLEGRQVGDELRLGEGLAGRAAAELRSVAASYEETGLRVRAHGRDVAVRHELHVPLRRGPAAVGVLTLARLGGGPFGEADVELAELVAPHAAAALQPVESRPGMSLPRQVDLVRLTRESVEAARPDAEARGVEVTLALESVPRCAGDPDRISLALDEVVSRAMTAAGPGGHVAARLFPRAGMAVVELAVDSGSSGGLDFARSVFEDHGGAVLVDGPGGAGTAFRIEIPLRALEHAHDVPER